MTARGKEHNKTVVAVAGALRERSFATERGRAALTAQSANIRVTRRSDLVYSRRPPSRGIGVLTTVVLYQLRLVTVLVVGLLHLVNRRFAVILNHGLISWSAPDPEQPKSEGKPSIYRSLLHDI
jgi:hypothetical protein